jgi:hypothetical protein
VKEVLERNDVFFPIGYVWCIVIFSIVFGIRKYYILQYQLISKEIFLLFWKTLIIALLIVSINYLAQFLQNKTSGQFTGNRNSFFLLLLLCAGSFYVVHYWVIKEVFFLDAFEKSYRFLLKRISESLIACLPTVSLLIIGFFIKNIWIPVKYHIFMNIAVYSFAEIFYVIRSTDVFVKFMDITDVEKHSKGEGKIDVK